jgi:hypothetical protein
VEKRTEFGEIGKREPLKPRQISSVDGLGVLNFGLTRYLTLWVQNGQEFFEVWVHPVPRPSSHTVLE